MVFLELYNAIMDEVKDTRVRVRDCKEFRRATTTTNQMKRKCGWTSRRSRSSMTCCRSWCMIRRKKLRCGPRECFKTFEMKANVSKLEIMVVAWSKWSKPISRKVARERLKFNVRGITIKATTSAKYLATKIDVMASSQKEVNARVQAASQAFTRLSRNMWKSGTLGERSKVKAFRTLVLPLLLYGTECLLLTKQQENKLERWQTKQLWKIVRSRSVFGKRHPASDELRERYQCPTIVSVIRQRRLALWKSVHTPFERVKLRPIKH